ncbi:rhomboid family intramembrane serine protease [Luteimonas sp. FXH3W]|uniref:Rhomboid family intramembrane serine protease n=1 Tax=Aquilutibacter rugosus TaxID=3115820 RepID=A0ABU7UWL2_9GAMM
MGLFIALPQKPTRHWTWATPLLLLIIIGLHAVQWWLGPHAQRQWQLQWGMLSGHLQTLHDWQQALQGGRLLRLYTATFLHINWSHAIGNLVFLLIFGPAAERVLGSLRFLLLFVIAGAISNLATVAAYPGDAHYVIGASGAISAVMGAYISLLPRAQLGIFLPLGFFVQVIKVPALALVSLWFAMQVIFVVVGALNGSVTWIGHIVGFVFGILFAMASRHTITKALRKQQGY